MIYGKFKHECKPGKRVEDRERKGTVIKISQDKEKALVRFEGGMVEWIEFYKIEML